MHADEVGYASVVGPFEFRVKTARRQLPVFPVVCQAQAALALPGTGLISAVARGLVSFDVAFHEGYISTRPPILP